MSQSMELPISVEGDACLLSKIALPPRFSPPENISLQVGRARSPVPNCSVGKPLEECSSPSPAHAPLPSALGGQASRSGIWGLLCGEGTGLLSLPAVCFHALGLPEFPRRLELVLPLYELFQCRSRQGDGVRCLCAGFTT